jgi:hypothetical protein
MLRKKKVKYLLFYEKDKKNAKDKKLLKALDV